jgi:hypothetical protein
MRSCLWRSRPSAGSLHCRICSGCLLFFYGLSLLEDTP